MSAALSRVRRGFLPVFAFSLVVNVLLLTAPLFMLQVYDRVLLSGSRETLFFLFGVAVFALLVLGLIDSIRQRLLVRVANRFDDDLGSTVFAETLRFSRSSQPVHDLNTIRTFISSPYTLALFDAPWIPLFLGLVYLLHPLLGHIGLAGALLLIGLAVLNELISRAAYKQGNMALGQASSFAEHSTRNREAVLGMGMAPALSRLWQKRQGAGLSLLSVAAERNARLSTFAKVIRQFLQIAVLAAGAWLTMDNITTAGVMIAASIIIARALAPIEQSIQGWRTLVSARQALQSLDNFLETADSQKPGMQLPRPRGELAISRASLSATMLTGSGLAIKPLLTDISLALPAGSSLGVIGPSGAGKTSLIRLILGVSFADSGEVRIDGAEMTPQLRDQFAGFMGYLPQDVELFDGSVAENIARFSDATPNDIMEAARLAGVETMILSLQAGYDTPIGPAGVPLSGGQKQRIGLARALFGSPAIVVLDEPTSSLDAEGQQAFQSALRALKARGTTVITISHQSHLLNETDFLALMANGRLERFGPTKALLADMLRPEARRRSEPVIIRKSASVVNLRESGDE
ncbi:type I secretion system permease/ATPase [Allohahella marinimesophila]|uniref:Type I secretion system permease/ATPase n=1 Tax=Allohahella marinimesophila TaxID=1054972 RepID=A0ABP7NK67_9GAMM